MNIVLPDLYWAGQLSNLVTSSVSLVLCSFLIKSIAYFVCFIHTEQNFYKFDNFKSYENPWVSHEHALNETIRLFNEARRNNHEKLGCQTYSCESNINHLTDLQLRTLVFSLIIQVYPRTWKWRWYLQYSEFIFFDFLSIHGRGPFY